MNGKRVLAGALWASGLFLSSFVIPLIGQISAPFAPVPLIILFLQGGRREGLAALWLAFLLTALFAGWPAAVVFFLGFGLMAAGASEGMLRGFRVENAVLLGGLLPVPALGLAAALYFTAAGVSPVAALDGSLRSIIEQAAGLYRSIGVAEEASLLLTLGDRVVHYLIRLMPSLVLAVLLLQTAFCCGIARLFLLRKGGGGAVTLKDEPLSSWYAPDPWVWGLIAALGLLALPWEGGRLIGWNLAILFGAVYTAQGIALSEYGLKRIRMPGVLRALMLALVLATPLLLIVLALGVVDVWADIRKVRAG